MGRCGLVRIAQAALLTAAAAVGAGYLDFGAFEICVALLGATALAFSGELAIAPAACAGAAVPVLETSPVTVPDEPIAWNIEDLQRRVAARAGRDPVRDRQCTLLLDRLRGFADGDGYLPLDLDELVRESFPDLIAA